MATAVWTENPRVDLELVRENLFAEPWTYEFFQAVRLIMLLNPSRSAIGFASNPATEPVRFSAHASLAFPPSAIQALTGSEVAPAQMAINFLGVIGPLGVLPRYITELVVQRDRSGDRSLHEFLDLFNHRLTSFFYRAWEKHHFTIAYERDGSDPLTGYLLSVIGLGSPLLQNRQSFPDQLLLFYAGLFGLRPKPAVALEAVLADYFGVDAEIEPFVGTWRRLDDDDQCFLEQEGEADSLGWGAVIGDEVWDQQSRIRIRIGPLTLERYNDFLPTGSAWPALQSIAKIFCGSDLEFELELLLGQNEVPVCRLGDPEPAEFEGAGPALGWTSWIKSQPVFSHPGVVRIGG